MLTSRRQHGASVLFSLSLFRGSHGKKYKNIILEFLCWSKGQKVDVLDHEENWSTAIILDTDYDNNKVKVGYLHWARIYDEWIHERSIRPPESMVWIDPPSFPLTNRYVQVEHHWRTGGRGLVVACCPESGFVKIRLLGYRRPNGNIRYFRDCKFLRPLTMKRGRLEEVLASIV